MSLTICLKAGCFARLRTSWVRMRSYTPRFSFVIWLGGFTLGVKKGVGAGMLAAAAAGVLDGENGARCNLWVAAVGLGAQPKGRQGRGRPGAAQGSLLNVVLGTEVPSPAVPSPPVSSAPAS